MGATRIVYGIVALALLAFAVFEGVKYGWIATAALVIGGIVPDLALIGGFSPTLEKGQLARRAVVPYNVLHSYWTALAIMAASFLEPVLWLRPGLEVFLVGLGWALHISIDRAVGYRFRTWDGYQRTAFTFA